MNIPVKIKGTNKRTRREYEREGHGNDDEANRNYGDTQVKCFSRGKQQFPRKAELEDRNKRAKDQGKSTQ